MPAPLALAPGLPQPWPTMEEAQDERGAWVSDGWMCYHVAANSGREPPDCMRACRDVEQRR